MAFTAGVGVGMVIAVVLIFMGLLWLIAENLK